MKKSLALFVFALGMLSLGFAETVSAQQFTSDQCRAINPGVSSITTGSDCATYFPGTFRVGDFVNAACEVLGSCCAASSPSTPPPACVAQTCLSTPDAYCGSYAQSGYIEGAGTCTSGRCYIPGGGGTCATQGGICVVGSCSQQSRKAGTGSCIGSDATKTCCTAQTFPACSGTCRNTSCNSGESQIAGAVCSSAYQVCCSAPVLSGPGSVTGPLLTDYQLLEQIPGSSNSAGRLNTYLEDIYRFAFWTVGIAVVFMLTIGGFMYLTSAGNTSRMESAKTVIFDAILGLVLALVAWLFLYVVNPDLVNVRLPSASITPSTAPTPPAPPVGSPSTSTWPADTAERSALPSNITVNRANCTTFGQPSCTSLAGTAALGAIQALSTACGNCSMTITGGTECWLHGSRDPRCNGTHHRQGDTAIDLAHSSALDSYIRSAGTVICSPRGRELYQIGNAVYWDEDSAHWHVNFNYTSCSGF